ncbi:exo-alpha-sialidase [Adhaeribacter swui]|uniref:Exo-alpha-sialidase n=1 Tax=Adhaeribacter swui TaxID=2086471 RepID=A0A7G7GC42_9BACT|nr:sialidase family protein [Adhaeribacter swui]QNF34726.1 exo-alpha-sialidase [Adhaeribacter swui]
MKLFITCIGFWLATIMAANAQRSWQITQEELIFKNPPFAECHASSLVEVSPGKILATWFAGTHERHPDVGIYVASQENGHWSKPELVADGVINDTLRYPCWNPVLFKTRAGKLLLFYKVGPSPSTWWGMLRTSTDNGKTWGPAEKLPEGILGPIKNKPVQLANGTILAPSSTETNEKWRIHLEQSQDDGQTWQLIPVDPGTNLDVIQPSVLVYPNNHLQLLSRSKHDRLVESWSRDNGKTWEPLRPTTILNPNSGTDAVTLKNKTQLLVYNPTTRGKDWSDGRAKLAVAISQDGKKWTDILTLEDQPKGEFSYPAVIQAADGKVHITYTYDRKNIKHVVLTEGKSK